MIPIYRVELVREPGDSGWASDKLSNSQHVFDRYHDEFSRLDRETFRVVMVDSKNRIIGENLVSVGSLSTSVVHPREVYKPVLILGASAVVFVHNHPSGDPEPSSEDVLCTNRLCSAGSILGIKVLDHIIIGGFGYFSFADAGMLDQKPFKGGD